MTDTVPISDGQTNKEPLVLEADVLVLGGGPAATWAAWSAASQGAHVVLADKGYCGSSGAAASGGNNVWYVPPDPAKREKAKASREAAGGYLSDRGWMDRVLDQTYENMQRLAEWGYPFPINDAGQAVLGGLHGTEYMRLMRKVIKKAGVRILDQSPALELLVDSDGIVSGASGIRRQEDRTWVVKAGAVVIATGGCAFLSKALGCNVLTGEGGLMAAEVGSEMSGMEFSNTYGISPAFASSTKGLMYQWATFSHEDGQPLDQTGPWRRGQLIARTLQTQPVYALLERAKDEQTRAWMRVSQPNFFLPLDRAGIDPFTQRFPITLRLEGTVRGTGGIRIADAGCATSVPGLYAAGDAATRELICGGISGGGSHNAAWAISSGTWAGNSAARYAQKLGAATVTRRLHGAGRAALRPDGEQTNTFDADEIIRAVQAEVFPYEKNLFRTDAILRDSLGQLDTLWNIVRTQRASTASDLQRAREAAAMVATARWMYHSARARTETRGMHQHEEHPEQDPLQRYRLLTGGLDNVWVAPDSVLPTAIPKAPEVALR